MGCSHHQRPVLRDRDPGAGGDLGKSGSGLDQRLYYTTDANMNVTALIEDDGDIAERYVYDPYGSVTVYSDDWSTTVDWDDSKKNPVRYCGYVFDTEPGLYHVRWRVYHPRLGRWLTRDPIGYKDGLSLYCYVGAEPTKQPDPYGMQRAPFRSLFPGGDPENMIRIELRKRADLEARYRKTFKDDQSIWWNVQEYLVGPLGVPFPHMHFSLTWDFEAYKDGFLNPGEVDLGQGGLVRFGDAKIVSKDLTEESKCIAMSATVGVRHDIMIGLIAISGAPYPDGSQPYYPFSPDKTYDFQGKVCRVCDEKTDKYKTVVRRKETTGNRSVSPSGPFDLDDLVGKWNQAVANKTGYDITRFDNIW